ncbi:unnamed protein product [Rotaria sp. Silwood1]|nr:unnamed protein product [Rotaria sp. Silwood1]CAF3414554.1 unnamed protein product [Rotaria sp. Silwood1]CAF3453375.1 unnamed protein product [Rotaria sp. Silwood1]CAF4565320.1 unnamed protein product [Rotaria sp. Silwood1]CAF4718107.1 unnamed protein product [Rotaria sp. Silwood1]
MEGSSLSVQIPSFGEQLISLLIFKSMSLVPSTNRKQVTLSALIIIQMNSPLGHRSPLNIQSMDMNVHLFYEENSVGMLDFSQVPMQKLNENTYQTQFTDKCLILSDRGSFTLGSLSISEIIVDNNITLVGLAGLNNVRLHDISVDGDEGTALQLSINMTIGNPGVTDIKLQNFTFNIVDSDNETVLGQIPINILSLPSGNNIMTLTGLLAALSEKDLPAVGKLFSAYLNIQTQSITLFHELSTNEHNATAMNLTISSLSVKSNLDGIEAKLIQRMEVLNFGIEFDSMIVNKVYITSQLSVLFQLLSNVHMTFEEL